MSDEKEKPAGEVVSWADIEIKIDNTVAIPAADLEAVNFGTEGSESPARAMLKEMAEACEAAMTAPLVAPAGVRGFVTKKDLEVHFDGTFKATPEDIRKIEEVINTQINTQLRLVVPHVNVGSVTARGETWGRYTEPKGPYEVEATNPEPYGNTTTADRAAFRDNQAHLAPFLFEVIDCHVRRPHQGDRFGMKWVQIQARVMPRADSPDAVGNDGARDADGAIKLTFSGSFEPNRPDALCIRELMMLALRHELEECIIVGTKRVWDPHIARPFNI